VLWAAKWEVRVDRGECVRVPRKTDQWVQRARGVMLVALWLCGRTPSEMQEGDAVLPAWDPELEANPLSEDWQEHVKEMDDDEADVIKRATMHGGLLSLPSTAENHLNPKVNGILCFQRRTDGDWEGDFCLICNKWASDMHLMSQKHLTRMRNLQDYSASSEAKAVSEAAEHKKDDTVSWENKERKGTLAHVESSVPPPTSDPSSGRIFLVPEMLQDGWIFEKCMLCCKWVTEAHLESKKHLERVANANLYVPHGWPRQVFPRMPSVVTWMHPKVKLQTSIQQAAHPRTSASTSAPSCLPAVVPVQAPETQSALVQANLPSTSSAPLAASSVSVPAMPAGEQFDLFHEATPAVSSGAPPANLEGQALQGCKPKNLSEQKDMPPTLHSSGSSPSASLVAP